MENQAFQRMTGMDSAEYTLPEMLGELMSPPHYEKFISQFQKFFRTEDHSDSAIPPLEGISIRQREELYRLSMQPFHTQEGELCSLVALQEMYQRVKQEAKAPVISPPPENSLPPEELVSPHSSGLVAESNKEKKAEHRARELDAQLEEIRSRIAEHPLRAESEPRPHNIIERESQAGSLETSNSETAPLTARFKPEPRDFREKDRFTPPTSPSFLQAEDEAPFTTNEEGSLMQKIEERLKPESSNAAQLLEHEEPSIPARKPTLSDLESDLVTPPKPIGLKKKGKPFKSEVQREEPRRLVRLEDEGSPESDASDPFTEKEPSFSVLPVLADLSKKLASVNKKEVRIDGDNFDEAIIPHEMKSTVLETLGQALKFSIINSVETREERIVNGKDPVASITISNKYEDQIAGLDKPGIVFYYKDDGRGVDSAVILEVARKARLTDKKSTEELTKNEVLGFLFNNQFNLPKKSPLDVVNLVRLKETVIRRLKGKMRLSYQEGQSFSFQLLAPTER